MKEQHGTCCLPSGNRGLNSSKILPLLTGTKALLLSRRKEGASILTDSMLLPEREADKKQKCSDARTFSPSNKESEPGSTLPIFAKDCILWKRSEGSFGRVSSSSSMRREKLLRHPTNNSSCSTIISYSNESSSRKRPYFQMI